MVVSVVGVLLRTGAEVVVVVVVVDDVTVVAAAVEAESDADVACSTSERSRRTSSAGTMKNMELRS